ncbi:unannotated protein [freshwater metagenome]|uniref:Unannotated protein n=1 Tax=freshwater metagenome TaxID=449393 RepID=A0A6J7CPP2_9ZZZZ
MGFGHHHYHLGTVPKATPFLFLSIHTPRHLKASMSNQTYDHYKDKLIVGKQVFASLDL